MGDSVFDNTSYVPVGYDVGSQLKNLLGDNWIVDNRAEDGATMTTVRDQIVRLSRPADQVLLSVGGNDALLYADLLAQPPPTVLEALSLVADATVEFERTYKGLLHMCAQAGRRLTVCTIYEGHHDKTIARGIHGALRVFNDVIFRCAGEAGSGVLDLRFVCSDPKDFVNSIEPSVSGGTKIAAAVSRVLSRQPRFSVYV